MPDVYDELERPTNYLVKLVICQNDGCLNHGVEFRLKCAPNVICGVCGTELTPQDI
jgi:hypothetical protein